MIALLKNIFFPPDARKLLGEAIETADKAVKTASTLKECCDDYAKCIKDLNNIIAQYKKENEYLRSKITVLEANSHIIERKGY